MVIDARMLALYRRATRFWVKSKQVPDKPLQELGIDPDKPIIYIFRQRSHTDAAAASRILEQLGLPAPSGELELPAVPAGESKQPATADTGTDQATESDQGTGPDQGMTLPRTLFIERRKQWWRREPQQQHRQMFAELLERHKSDPTLDVQLLPISVFWGRNPGKDNPTLAHLLLDRSTANWLRKLLSVLLLGRDNFIQFSRSVSLRTMVDKHGADDRSVHKLLRVARVHFFRQRQASMGPPRPDRNKMIAGLLHTPLVQQAIEAEVSAGNLSRERAERDAIRYGQEIVAAASNTLLTMGDRALCWLWSKLYDGITVRGADQVRDLARHGHEVIYVPCHRSHMDYLLLTYVIYRQGLVTPHIAAGINLNFWPAGPIFRHSGAFFIRRSFRGNKIYGAVFREYLHQLYQRGDSVKFFLEGGRSRTGRLLPAKPGMLNMTIQSQLRSQERPLSLVPVHIGYENVMEVGSYLKELQGAKKEKESVGQVFGAIRSLKQAWGQAYVNFGEPILLTDFLSRTVPEWRDDIGQLQDQRPAWLNTAVEKLGNQVMVNINNAAAVNSLNLSALILLAAPKHALARDEMEALLESYSALLRTAPYSERVTLPEGDGKTLLTQALSLEKFQTHPDAIGEVISLDKHTAVAMTYYRNNILHLMILPALIASFVTHHQQLSYAELMAGIRRLYPLLQAKLFMGLDEEQLNSYCQQLLQAMLEQELLVESTAGQLTLPGPLTRKLMQLNHLAASAQETLQRYAVMLSLLSGSEPITQQELQRRTELLAQRLSILHGINAPEFYDTRGLSNLTKNLLSWGYLTEAEQPGHEGGEESDKAVKGFVPTNSLSELSNILFPLIGAEVYQALQYEMHKEQPVPASDSQSESKSATAQTETAKSD